MIRLAMLLVLGAFTLWAVPPTTASAQQADPRDSEGAYFAPSNTLSANLYVRHISSMESPSEGSSQMLGLVRGTYLLKFGDFSFTPMDFFIPVVDVHSYGASVNHLSGIADPRYLPTIAYHLTQDAASLTHTWFSLTTYLQLPFGQYNTDRFYRLNIGENRFSVQPVLTIGQRLFKVLTVEGFFGAQLFMDNTDATLLAVNLAPDGMTPIGTTPTPGFTVAQDLGLNGGVHVALDLSRSFNIGFSYMYTGTGAQTVKDANGAALVASPLLVGSEGTAEGEFHEMRVTMAVSLAPTTTLRLQWAEGLARSGSAALSRYIGLRFSHATFFGAPPPGAPPAAPPAAPPPPPSAPLGEDDPAEL